TRNVIGKIVSTSSANSLFKLRLCPRPDTRLGRLEVRMSAGYRPRSIGPLANPLGAPSAASEFWSAVTCHRFLIFACYSKSQSCDQSQHSEIGEKRRIWAISIDLAASSYSAYRAPA